ncbi:protein SIEVE ELEMENT OCCLUSION B-like [Diospyros lotus]|uniref:protein SIEVE ELEMENT OCCLUSION B-like n=1 Tax=Diospyros lotus TaxID=55363 RepID=UPI00225A8E7D|nr:protein SIEVE ELEMENT OCCLUSION B-like [Diospyros lotus]
MTSTAQPAKVLQQQLASNLQPTKTKQLRSERRMFSASDDSAMMKQIQATHAPDGREVDAKPILLVIEDILRRATPSIDGVVDTVHGLGAGLEEKVAIPEFEGVLESSAYIIQKVSCELSCKCSGGGDAHATTMEIFNILSYYSWDAKVVISLAAFAVNYGEFWLVAKLCATNQLAKSIALLKQLPDIIEQANTLKSRFDAINILIKAITDVTELIVEFKQLPSQYISPDTPPMSTAMTHIPTAAYWTIRSMVACATQIISLLGLSYEHITSTTEAWELSSLTHKVNNIHEHLNKQLFICHQYIDEKRHAETYQLLVHLFTIIHLDNMRIIKQLIYPKDDQLPLLDGATRKRVSVEVLRRKNVLLLISDLDLWHEEIMILAQLHQEMRARSDLVYEIVWLPIIDRSMPWTEEIQHKFELLQGMMPWYMVHHPSLIEPAVIRYIKEVWGFDKRPILVALDPQAKVVSQNAFHMIWIWGNLAFPFTSAREESLWKEETWRLELVVDGIDPAILDWIGHGKFVCLYGGEDIEWIRKFTAVAKSVAKDAGITLEMVYVGKNGSKERVRRITDIIAAENLSHFWSEPMYIWYFWTRLESMLYSKLQLGKTIENDQIMREVLILLSYDGSHPGWAIIGKGSDEMARGKDDMMLKILTEFKTWEEEARNLGFVPALIEMLRKLHSPQHCNRLILPGMISGVPEKIVCAECGRPMEKFYMYRCCTD